MLNDKKGWNKLSPGHKVAWFTEFAIKHFNVSVITNTEDSIANYGHLLGGAPLSILSEIPSTYSTAFKEVLRNNDMNALRVQEIWQALEDRERAEIFGVIARKLDSKQLAQFYTNNFGAAHTAGSDLATNIFIEGNNVAFENILLIAKYHHGDLAPSKWDQPRLYDTGKFVVAL